MPLSKQSIIHSLTHLFNYFKEQYFKDNNTQRNKNNNKNNNSILIIIIIITISFFLLSFFFFLVLFYPDIVFVLFVLYFFVLFVLYFFLLDSINFNVHISKINNIHKIDRFVHFNSFSMNLSRRWKRRTTIIT